MKIYKPGYIHIDCNGQKWIKLASGGWLRMSYIRNVREKDLEGSC